MIPSLFDDTPLRARNNALHERISGEEGTFGFVNFTYKRIGSSQQNKVRILSLLNHEDWNGSVPSRGGSLQQKAVLSAPTTNASDELCIDWRDRVS